MIVERVTGIGTVEHHVEHRVAHRHGERVAAERAGLVDGAERCEEVHDLGATPEGADGKSAADDLSETREIWPYPKEPLRPARRRAKPRDHLVEHQDRAVPEDGGARPDAAQAPSWKRCRVLYYARLFSRAAAI